jgi:hypothetical protein
MTGKLRECRVSAATVVIAGIIFARNAPGNGTNTANAKSVKLPSNCLPNRKRGGIVLVFNSVRMGGEIITLPQEKRQAIGGLPMEEKDLDEAREVFVGIMDEMDYQGDPDDLGVYRNIREIFDAGARLIVADAQF